MAGQVMITRRKFMGAKAVSTIGTDPVPTAGSDAIVTYNLAPKVIETEPLPRKPMSGNLSSETAIPGLISAGFTCETYLSGSGAAGTAPDYGILLRGAGFSETIVGATSVAYAPTSTFDGTSGNGLKALAAYLWIDGKLYKSLDSAGTCSLEMEVGLPGKWMFDYQGNYSQPTVVTLPAPTFSNHENPERILNIAATFTPSGGSAFTGVLRKLKFDNATDVQLRPDANATGGGYIGAAVVDREPKWEYTVEESETYTDGAANMNWYAKLEDQVAGAWAIGPLGSVAGKTINMSIPNMSTDSIEFAEENGMGVLNISGTPATNAIATGDDEFVITIT